MKKKILLVDDDPELRKLVSKILESDFEVILAEDGETALDELDTLVPDLIILDIELPDMNGYEICEKIKYKSQLQFVPVLMLSANKGYEARIRGYQVGALNYLEKPFHTLELKTIISNLISEEARTKDVWEFKDIVINSNSQSVTIAEKRIEVTRFEFKILLAMIKQPGVILSRDYLLELLYPDLEERTDRLIDSHMSHLRRKLKESQVSIKSVYGKGYKIITN